MDLMRIGKNPNYLGSWDLDDVPGGKITVTIDKICEEEVITAGQKEKCAVAHFAEDFKPMILNLTNKKRIARMYKTKVVEKICGKRVTIGTEKVKAFGDVFDALRIVPVIPPEKEENVKCEECGNVIAPMGKMSSSQVAAYTRKKYGRCLCGDCATRIAKENDK